MSDYTAFTLNLKDSAVSLELVPAFGGRINRLVLSDKFRHNLIAGLYTRDALENDTGFRGIPLFPFPNRLAQGRYAMGGKTYQLPINEPGRGNTLHGFLFQLEPEIRHLEESETSAQATLTYRYPGNLDGYPFPCEVNITYKLLAEALEIVMHIHNTGKETMPVGFGWHPYYQLDNTVDDLLMRLPPVKEIKVDERGIATGDLGKFTHFEKLSTIGAIKLDTGLLIENPPEVAKALLWSEKLKYGLEIWQDAGDGGLNYLQVFIPPRRESIAIEPMSSSINAFNTGEGLRMLAPGDSTDGTFGVRLLSQKPE